MDHADNPYRPGAGTRPLVLAGRHVQLAQIDTLLRSVRRGAPQRSLMFYGLRGVGKTVLLTQAEKIATPLGFVVEHLEMSEQDEFRRVIAKVARQCLTQLSAVQGIKERIRSALSILNAFAIVIPNGPELRIDVAAAVGIADTGDLQSDLVALLVALAEAAHDANAPVCILIDEVQYLSEDAVSGLIAASHRITQRELPLAFVCAGLPQVAALAGDAKSYAERLFEFVHIDRLKPRDAEEALRGPAAKLGVEYDDDAAAALLAVADGYPYFLQELGKRAWNLAEQTPITMLNAEEAIVLTLDALDESFFKVRLDRATAAEKSYMRAMAQLGDGPYKVADVAGAMNRRVNSLGPVRATLISKGFVYAPQFGCVDFTVPQFDDFMQRHLP